MFLTVNKQLKRSENLFDYHLGLSKERFKKTVSRFRCVHRQSNDPGCVACYVELSRSLLDAGDVQKLIVPLKAVLLNISVMFQTKTLFRWCKNCAGANDKVTLLFALAPQLWRSPAPLRWIFLLLECETVMVYLWLSSSRRFEKPKCVRVRNRNAVNCTPTRKQQRCDCHRCRNFAWGTNINWAYWWKQSGHTGAWVWTGGACLEFVEMVYWAFECAVW
jgi:hypothetical protein